jgi:putative hydrolases of HD superfamily
MLLCYRCMELSLIHDMGESIIGDITPYCGVPRDVKLQKEREAIEKLSQLAGAGGDKIRALYHVS